MLFGNTHVEKALGIFFGKTAQPGSVWHGRGYGNNSLVFGSQLAECRAENSCIGSCAALSFQHLSGADIKGPHPVKQGWIVLGRFIPLALFGKNMDQHGVIEFFDVLQGLNQLRQVMTVDWADIFETKGLEHHCRCKEPLEGILHLACHMENILANSVKTAKERLYVLLEPMNKFTGGGSAEKTGKCPDILGNRHLIVIEDHNQVLVQSPGMVHSFKGNAACHGAVTDHRQHLVLAAIQVTPYRKTGGCRDGGGGMPHIKGIVGRFGTFGKSADPVQCPQGCKTVAAPGQDLVGIGLMPHIPDDLVLRGVEHTMQGDRQLHHTKRRGDVAAIPCTCFYDNLTQLCG